MDEQGSSAVDGLKQTTRAVLAKLERLKLDPNCNPGDTRDCKSSGRTTRVRTRKNKNVDVTNPPTDTQPVRGADPIDHSMQFLLDMLLIPQSR